MEGRIRFFNAARHYGVVENDGGSWFFSASSVLTANVGTGDIVNFSLADDPKNVDQLIAVDVAAVGGEPRDTKPDPCRLFVSNIPLYANEEELKQVFEQAGGVDRVELIRDRQTREPRGFGFVQMSDARSALTAIAQLHGHEWGDGRIVVQPSARRKRTA